jgi:hypothetical protein
MIVASIQARDLKLELFEGDTLEDLQDELEEWLSTRTEERIVGIDFDADGTGESMSGSYRAYVLYTE